MFYCQTNFIELGKELNKRLCFHSGSVVDCISLYCFAMVRQFHDGMQTCVQNDGEFSEPFEVTNGVK